MAITVIILSALKATQQTIIMVRQIKIIIFPMNYNINGFIIIISIKYLVLRIRYTRFRNPTIRESRDT